MSTARNRINEDTILVDYDIYHQGHDLCSFDDWRGLILAARVRKWPTKFDALGLNCVAIKNLLRPDKMTLDVLDGEGTSGLQSYEVSELPRITNQDFNNCRQRHPKNIFRLGSSCLDSLIGYIKSLNAVNWIATVEDLNLSLFGNHFDFFFAFCTK